MLRSLYTGISGMRSMQTMMDVTGNNIANVNTTGYKTANTVFEDTLSQTLANATAPQGTNGGSNPAQVGLGVRVSSITTNFTQGATQVTGRNTDMLVDGDGFFVVRNNGVDEYTRNGAFNLDTNGNLTGSGGTLVMGWQADANGAVNTTSALTPINIPAGMLSNPKVTDTVTLSGYLNNAATGEATPGDGAAATAGSVVTMNYPINDKQGRPSDLKLTFTPQEQTDPTKGTTVTDWAVSGEYNGQAFAGTLSIDTDGTKTFTPAAGALTTAAAGTNGSFTIAGLTGSDGATFDITVDATTLKSSAQNGQSSSANVQSQNGHPASTLSSWKIGSDGSITGTFSDGTTQTLAKIAVATFNNPAGLSKEGGSLYSATVNSGTPSVGSPGEAGRGSIVSGALEMSNVDLAQEFTNLIVSQRGFQANSRVITTSDSLLEELVNLKR